MRVLVLVVKREWENKVSYYFDKLKLGLKVRSGVYLFLSKMIVVHPDTVYLSPVWRMFQPDFKGILRLF